MGMIAKVDLSATWKIGCIPMFTNFTRTWLRPSKIEKTIRKVAATPSIDLFVI
jgi:hypothetical protein